LFVGESEFEPGTRDYFEHHRQIVIDDCFAGTLPDHLFPETRTCKNVLDLGCGPGMWSIELLLRGAESVTSADLTSQAITLVQQRAAIYGFSVNAVQQNAEAMDFADEQFSHVNCQGVIHHTPDTSACVREIARVLEPGGTAVISVYYRNVFIRAWPVLRYVG
jgi:2-polyprenyl-3-methyl-5-hydroxy-6-metoxy-1,4-benzoquinol methylase